MASQCNNLLCGKNKSCFLWIFISHVRCNDCGV